MDVQERPREDAAELLEFSLKILRVIRYLHPNWWKNPEASVALISYHSGVPEDTIRNLFKRAEILW